MFQSIFKITNTSEISFVVFRDFVRYARVFVGVLLFGVLVGEYRMIDDLQDDHVNMMIRPQLAGGRPGEPRGRGFTKFYIRKPTQNLTNVDPNHHHG